MWLWRTLVTAAVIIVLAAGFFAEENSRGVIVWKKCERELAARGESLDWKRFLPAPAPDEKNFVKAPMLTEWFVRSTNAVASQPPYHLPVSNLETMAPHQNSVNQAHIACPLEHHGWRTATIPSPSATCRWISSS